MKDYVVSARKYRPQFFKDVAGQDAAVKTLKNALKTGQLAHAFLFCGPRGVGKTTCARLLAKAINCQQLTDEIEPCNVCVSCTSFNNHTSFNIYELDAASNNSVEDIRSLVDQVRYPPQYGLYKVYIIDEVHMLSSAAFNAFLKTLEEPPSYASFILATTEKHKVLPTILSRCQLFDFQRITPAGIVQQLKQVAQTEGIVYSEEALYLIGYKSDGALRDALSMFDVMVNFGEGKITYEAALENLHVLDYNYYFRLIPTLLAGHIADALLLYEEIIQTGFDGIYFLEGLLEHFRNLLVAQDLTTVSLLATAPRVQEKYRLQAQTLPSDYLLAALTTVSTCIFQYKESINKRFHVELLLVELAQKSPGALQATIDKTSQPLINIPSSLSSTDKTEQTVAIAPPPSASQPEEIASTTSNSTPQVTLDVAEEVIMPVIKEEVASTASNNTPQMTLGVAEEVITPVIKEEVPSKVSNSTAPLTLDIAEEVITPVIKEVVSSASSSAAQVTVDVSREVITPTIKKETLRSTIKIPQIAAIKAELKKNNTQPVSPSLSADSVTPLAYEKVMVHWQVYAQRCKEAKKISAYNLLQNPFQIVDNTIQVSFSHTVEGHILSEIKEELVNYLRQQLQHPALEVIGILTSDGEPTSIKPYTAQERFLHLLSKNPILGLMKEQFQLEEIA